MSTHGLSWSSMTVIERMRYIHGRFIETKSREDSQTFRRNCGKELRIPRYGERRSRKAGVDPYVNHYFKLACRTGRTWEYIYKIFHMWERGYVKEQQKGREMKIRDWESMHNLYDEEIVVPVLERVVSRKFSLYMMEQEFMQCKNEQKVKVAFMRAFQEQTWSGCKAKYNEHAMDDAVKYFVPLFRGWNRSVYIHLLEQNRRREKTFHLTGVVNSTFPNAFNDHIQQARTWLQQQQQSLIGTRVSLD
ncbi:unnamed protein product [Calypogeia fissa]